MKPPHDLSTLVAQGRTQMWTARPNGELDWVSAEVTRYFGRDQEQMLAWGWADLVHPDDLEHVGEQWSHALETGEPYAVRFRLLRADGSWRWHVGRASAHVVDGVITAWLGINTDVHELFAPLD